MRYAQEIVLHLSEPAISKCVASLAGNFEFGSAERPVKPERRRSRADWSNIIANQTATGKSY